MSEQIQPTPNILDMLTLADMLEQQRNEKKNLKSQLDALSSVIQKTELLLFDKMLDAEMQRFSRNGNTFYMNPRTLASVPSDNNDLVNSWFRSHGMGDLVQEKINPQTLNSQLKEMMGDGGTVNDLPADLRSLLSFYDKPQVGIRKG